MAVTKDKTIDIADFFTTTKEREGVWYEAKVQGVPTGLMFKVLGYASDENVLSAEAYKKEHELAEKETDVAKKAEMEREAVCNRLTAIVTDLKAVEGKNIVLNGEPLTYSKEIVKKIFWESIDIRTDVFNASFDSTNFMTKKF